MLESLGVQPDVEQVYRALLGNPGTTPTALAEVVGQPVAVVEDALAGLVASGLALRSDDQAYVVAPPAVALGALITERRDELRLAEQALASLAEEHRAATAGRTISELIEVVTGVDQIRHRFQQVQQAAVTELRTFITAPFVAVPPGRTTPSRPPWTAGSGSEACSSAPCSPSRTSSTRSSTRSGTGSSSASSTRSR